MDDQPVKFWRCSCQNYQNHAHKLWYLFQWLAQSRWAARPAYKAIAKCLELVGKISQQSLLKFANSNTSIFKITLSFKSHLLNILLPLIMLCYVHGRPRIRTRGHVPSSLGVSNKMYICALSDSKPFGYQFHECILAHNVMQSAWTPNCTVVYTMYTVLYICTTA